MGQIKPQLRRARDRNGRRLRKPCRCFHHCPRTAAGAVLETQNNSIFSPVIPPFLRLSHPARGGQSPRRVQTEMCPSVALLLASHFHSIISPPFFLRPPLALSAAPALCTHHTSARIYRAMTSRAVRRHFVCLALLAASPAAGAFQTLQDIAHGQPTTLPWWGREAPRTLRATSTRASTEGFQTLHALQQGSLAPSGCFQRTPGRFPGCSSPDVGNVTPAAPP